MKTISTKIAKQLIDEAIKHGKSSQIEVVDSELNYLRLLVSRYNSANNTKISVNRVHNKYVEISAPKNRFYDDPMWKPAFDLIQNVLTDDTFILNDQQMQMIEEKLQNIATECYKSTKIEKPVFAYHTTKTEKLASDYHEYLLQ